MQQQNRYLLVLLTRGVDLRELTESSSKSAKIAEERPPVGFVDSIQIGYLPNLRKQDHLALWILLEVWKKRLLRALWILHGSFS